MAEKGKLTGFESPSPNPNTNAFHGNARLKQPGVSPNYRTNYSPYNPTSPNCTPTSPYYDPTSPNYSEVPRFSQYVPASRNYPPEIAAQLHDQEQRRAKREALERPLAKLRESIVKQTDFSLSLAKHVISTTADGSNFVFSPLSMHVVLCMVAAGSSGPTRAQFLGYLKSKSVEELNSLSSQVATLLFSDGGPLGGPRLSFADGVWVDQSLTLKPAFKETVQNDYKAASFPADFQNKAEEVREEVNWWAEKETNGLIKNLLPPGSLDSQTSLVLANALYFKGAWVDKFDASLTEENDFFLNGGTDYVRVPFMSSRKKQLVRAFDGFKVLMLPYEQGDDNRRFSMLIYLPDDRDGLPALLDEFGSQPQFIRNHLPIGRVVSRQFRVPKFKINFGFEATQVVKGQGLVLPFSPGGLTEMVDIGGERLEVSSFFHKSCIEVDEKGTEAAAASGWVMSISYSLDPPPDVDFVADHPFLFVVREDVSGAVLFVGQLLNPCCEVVGGVFLVKP